MNRIKRSILAMLLTLSLAVSLTGCGSAGEEEKVKVGVSWAADEIAPDIQAYLDAVEKAGGEAIYLPQITTEEEAEAALDSIDALVMCGGEDIDPSFYGQEPSERLGEVNEARDLSDSLLIEAALKEDIPMLATCRGMQMMNALQGGTLYQDLPTQHPSEVVHRDPDGSSFVKHEVTVDPDNIVADAFGGEGTYTVNSLHHQAVDEIGENLKVVAVAEDGIVEAYVKEDSTYVMGLQFHPEGMVAEGDESFLTFYTNLIEAAK